MSTKCDGGQAFPDFLDTGKIDFNGRAIFNPVPGMTLRDYAEIQFISAFLSNECVIAELLKDSDGNSFDFYRHVAANASAQFDALLDRREKGCAK